MSNLSEFQIAKNHHLLKDVLTTREKFATELLIARKTLYRWEREIIFSLSKLSNEYQRSSKLDRYQKCLLLMIHATKTNKILSRKERTNSYIKRNLYVAINQGFTRNNSQTYFALIGLDK